MQDNRQVAQTLTQTPPLLNPPVADQTAPTVAEIRAWLTAYLADILEISADQIDQTVPFDRYGLDSALAMGLSGDLEDWLNRELVPTLLYDYPTIEALAQHLHSSGLAAPAAQLTPIQPVSRQIPLPLSFSQQRLWLLHQIHPGSTAYNLSLVLEIAGSLDLAALQQSLTTLIQRHEVLRTTFAAVDGKPVQVIHPAQASDLSLIDLTDLAIAERTAAVQQLTAKAAQHHFDLSQGPLMQVTLLKTAIEQYRLLITLHHAVADGGSVGIFMQEVMALYSAYAQGQPHPLPPLSIQYADYAYWQRQWLQGERLQQGLAYWRQHLADAPSRLTLPTDRPRPATPAFQGGRINFAITAKLTQQLKRLGQQTGATLFMTLLAAFAVLLGRYSHQPEVVIGAPIANRHRRELEPLIGFFVNTLALRADLGGNPSFQELLERIRQTVLAAYHHNMPFEKVVEVLQPQRSLNHHPIFQVMFVLQNLPAGPLELPGLKITPVDLEEFPANFDLTLSLNETAQGLEGFMGYNANLFEAATLARMVQHFQTLLNQVVAQPQQPLAQLPLLSSAERAQLLEDAAAEPIPLVSASGLAESVTAAAEIDHLLAELEGLSETDVEQLLHDQTST
ncbi:condensation domain-containing protein [Sphaerothrix gracilis]|uniref:condensation domain-containing protein n=1 Tax=Sphaerothrix gracilis TaxID=3151835 RepID=UPI0031FC8BBC